MIDLTDEFKGLKDSSSKDVLDNLRQERKILEKKIHVFNVLTLIDTLEDMLDKNLLDKNDIQYLFFEKEYNMDVGNYFYCFLINSESHIISCELSEEVKASVERLDGFRNDLVSEEMKNSFQIKASKEGLEKLKENLLSSDLLASINYSRMQAEIPNKTITKPKSRKI